MTKTAYRQDEFVVFLDFDGVLHPNDVRSLRRSGPYVASPPGHQLFEHAPFLETLLMPYPDIKSVFSTSWVRALGFSRAAKRLPPGLRDRVIGATFHRQMNESEFVLLSRGAQFWSDVVRRKTRRWLAIDDTDEEWPEHCRSSLFTDSVRGIGDDMVQKLLRQKLAWLGNGKTPAVE